MAALKKFFTEQRPAIMLVAAILVLTTIPALEIFFVVGDAWQGIIPPFSDEINSARLHTIGEGHLTDGNPFFIEHSDGAPLVIFGGAWINALPLWAGFPLVATMFINFGIWSVLFALSAYWLLRELHTPRWGAVFGTLFLYMQSYAHVWRPINLQTVSPFYFLFFIALLYLIRRPCRKNILFLALALGATFYFYSYLWQIAVITLGLLVLYALAHKDWPLFKGALFSSMLGGIIGLPVPLYVLWLSHSSPYFWESVGRLGLVNTHIPMAEIVYSGGWIGVACTLLAVLLWRVRTLREDKEFTLVCLFLAISGFGLWVMEGSNLLTGKLLETGEHMVGFIMLWLVCATFCIGAFLWGRRAQLSRSIQALSLGVLLVLSIVGARYLFINLQAFLPPWVSRDRFQEAQLYAKPFAWLQREEQNPVVVWSDPHDALATLLPIYTRHFTLYAYWGMLELVPGSEVRERYLVSDYFNDPTGTDLKNNITLYLGRQDTAHIPKTIERRIKICRILFFWDTRKNCGTPPTPQELLGEQFFADMEKKFQTDIKPNIKAYLKKYHVSYILKDKELDPTYRPEKLGAVRVYQDGRFELYKLPQ